MCKYLLSILLVVVLAASCGTYMPESEAIKLNAEGLAEMNHGRMQNAIDKFKLAATSTVLSKASKTTIYRNIAQSYVETGDLDSALRYFNIVAELYEKNTYHYLVNKADVELLNKNIPTAIVLLNRAYKLEPNDLAVNNNLGIIYMGYYNEDYIDYEKALPYNQKTYEINVDRISQQILGQNYFHLGKLEDAELHYETLNKQYGDLLDMPFFLGVIKYKLGKKEEAEELWQKVVAEDLEYEEAIEYYKIIF